MSVSCQPFRCTACLLQCTKTTRAAPSGRTEALGGGNVEEWPEVEEKRRERRETEIMKTRKEEEEEKLEKEDSENVENEVKKRYLWEA